MINKITRASVALFGMCLAVAIYTHAWAVSGSDVPRISKEDLRGQLGDSQIVVIDVRTKKDWDKSGYKVTGAMRENPDDVESWSRKYPKDKTIVLYCA